MKFKRYVLPSLLILLLGASVAISQTYKAALQLSQDLTGAFSVDTNNGVYFPGHILSTGINRPVPTIAAGAGTATLAGTDVAGVVTLGATSTTATITFGQAFLSTPACLVALSNPGVTTEVSWVPATQTLALTWTGAAGTSNKAYFFCPSVS
jgi:hypothetical protein